MLCAWTECLVGNEEGGSEGGMNSCATSQPPTQVVRYFSRFRESQHIRGPQQGFKTEFIFYLMPWSWKDPKHDCLIISPENPRIQDLSTWGC